MTEYRRYAEARRQEVMDAFNRLTPSQKSDLILAVPDLYFATARFVRHAEAAGRLA